MKPTTLVPMAYVRSVRQAIEFYRKLGFEEGNTHTPEGRAEPVWAWLQSDQAHLMLAEASEPVAAESRAVLFYIYYSPRGEFRVIDPDGYVLMISHT